MRKLKFRAFDLVAKQMLHNVMYCDGAVIHVDDSVNWIPQSRMDGSDCAIVMQFTGILDKNGKEIYEGDIIFNDMSENKASVKWDETIASYTVIDEDSSWLYFHEIFDDLNCYEIIGNIYENPNLL